MLLTKDLQRKSLYKIQLLMTKQNMEHCTINQAVGHDHNKTINDKKMDTIGIQR